MKVSFKEKAKEIGINLRAKGANLALTVSSGITTGILMSGTVYANDNSWNAGFKSGIKGGNLMQSILDKVVHIFLFMGAFFVVSGVYKLVMAYKDNQPEQQNAAVRDIVIGVVLIVFDTVLWNPISNLIFDTAGAGTGTNAG